jgi:RNA polymerase sigma-70 factor, ECF subfamily
VASGNCRSTDVGVAVVLPYPQKGWQFNRRPNRWRKADYTESWRADTCRVPDVFRCAVPWGKNVTDQTQPEHDRRAAEFTELYSSCERKLYVYIVSLIGDPLDSLDLLQETSLVLWQKFDQFRPGTRFLAWAREVARLRVLRYWRMHDNNTLLLQTSAIDALSRHFDSATDGSDRFYSDALADCVEALRETDRELIKLRYRSGISVQALAEKLGRSANALSHSLGRIRRLLRTCVEETAHRKQVEGDSAK